MADCNTCRRYISAEESPLPIAVCHIPWITSRDENAWLTVDPPNYNKHGTCTYWLSKHSFFKRLLEALFG